MRGADYPHVDDKRLVLAHAANFARLEKPQKFDLDVLVQFAEFVEELRAAADYLGRGQSADTMPRIGDIHRKLVDEVLPHEEAEDRQLYPALDKLLGGVDPTGAMSRAHVEIARQTRQLGVLLDDIGSGAPNPVDVAELQRLMYGLHAILRLHTIQEDESFLSLTDHGT